MRLFSFLYSFSLAVVALTLLPKFLNKVRKSGFGWVVIKQKLGLGLQEAKRRGQGAIWLHAVSLGETKALIPLIKQIKETFPTTPLLITSTTDTGYREAERLFPDAIRFFLPWDFKWIMKRLIKAIQPKMVLLSETEFWFHFLKEAKKIGALTGVVSAKISDRSLKRFSLFPFFTKKVFSLLDFFLVQNKLYEHRFLSLGVSKEKIKITGNLKFDISYPSFPERKKEGKSVVFASTHFPEEEELIQFLDPLLKAHSDWRFFIVPRHPHRFEEVFNVFQKKGIHPVRFSRPEGNESQWIVVDKMGVLGELYSQASVAVVCGSFRSRVGGHNIIEPLAYGTPVLFGPYMSTQLESEKLVLEAGAGKKIDSSQLVFELEELLREESVIKEMGGRGVKLVESLQGVGKNTWDALRGSF